MEVAASDDVAVEMSGKGSSVFSLRERSKHSHTESYRVSNGRLLAHATHDAVVTFGPRNILPPPPHN